MYKLLAQTRPLVHLLSQLKINGRDPIIGVADLANYSWTKENAKSLTLGARRPIEQWYRPRRVC